MENWRDTLCLRFIEKYYNSYRKCSVLFHIAPLKRAIKEACYAEDLSARRVLLLYFHNEGDEFSQKFCGYLKHDDIANFLNNHFYVLAWDVTLRIKYDMLRDEVKQMFDLDMMVDFITRKKSAIFLITSVSSNLIVFSFMHGSVNKDNLMFKLQQVQKAMKEENKIEEELQRKCGIGSERFQQMMYDRLGDRDYDSFEFDQHEYLKNKIGFAFYGSPKNEKGGYDEKEEEKITCLYDKICLVNNEHSKWHDRVVISFIYNCTEPLPEEKLARAKEYTDYDPLTDLCPVPVFVLRKCKGSGDPCRVFIDHTARVYTSWKKYLEKNKLPKCKMVLPKDGRYQGDDKVLLEERFSPACDMSVAILEGADIVSSLGGMASGGVLLATTAIAVAPVALTIAGITGIGVGAYSILRSSFALADRSTHRQTMSFLNSEARGAYINIVAGTLGFAGSGAIAAVSTLSARGVNIGMGTRVLVNTINGAKIATGGVGIVNSTWEVINQIMVERETPSALTIVQLSSSILFFGNAVYNFRTCGTIIKELRTLNDIENSLRSNRYRKMFSKFVKKSMGHSGKSPGKTEVIGTLRNVNKDEALQISKLLSRFTKDIQEDIIKIAKLLIDMLTNEGLDFVSAFQKLFPHKDAFYVVIDFLISVLQEKVDEMEQEYQNKLAEAKAQPGFNERAFNSKNNINPCKAKRTLDFFGKFLHLFFLKVELALRKLTNTFNEWLKEQIDEYRINRKSIALRRYNQQQWRIFRGCPVCNGKFYPQ